MAAMILENIAYTKNAFGIRGQDTALVQPLTKTCVNLTDVKLYSKEGSSTAIYTASDGSCRAR